MLPTISLVKKLRIDFPHITFTEAVVSRWSQSQQTVFFNPTEPHSDWILLHELGHACLQHTRYHRDVELLAMERDAWQHATTVLAPAYQLSIDPGFIEDHLDTYRDWLHAKSTCPACTLTGIEVSKQLYRCVGCHHTWTTNEGVQRRIQRYSQKRK